MAGVHPRLRAAPARLAALCASARLDAPGGDDGDARQWLQARLQPYRVESLDGAGEGLITGYFEPLVEAPRVPRGGFRMPLYAPPRDLRSRQPYWTRQQIDSAARRAGRAARPRDRLRGRSRWTR